jgi:hypothetical protein
MKRLIVFTAIIIYCSWTAVAQENTYKYFCEAQSLCGPSGCIHTFSPYVLPCKNWSFGLHIFLLDANYAPIKNFETGIACNMKELLPIDSPNKKSANINDTCSLHAKYSFSDQLSNVVDAAAGFYRDSLYCVAGKNFYVKFLNDVGIYSSISLNKSAVKSAFVFTQTMSLQQLIIELQPQDNIHNFGYRFLLSPEMKLDLFFTDFTHIRNIFLDNFVFGLTMVV